MNWDDVNDKWLDLNKEILFSFFIDEVLPKFYSDKVLERFKSITLSDIKIYTNYNGNSIKIEIVEEGKKNVEYLIVGSHVSLFDFDNYRRRVKRDEYLEIILSDDI